MKMIDGNHKKITASSDISFRHAEHHQFLPHIIIEGDGIEMEAFLQ